MRSIIWDMGGTLVDTYGDVDRTLAEAATGRTDEATLHEVAQLTRVSSGHAISELAARYEVDEQTLRSAYDALKDRWRDQPAPVMDGAREVMAAVSRGGGLNLVATHRSRESAQILLDALGLTMDDMICAPDGHPRKPDPEMNEALLQRHGLSPAQALAVGDRPGDIRAAQAAGIRAVLLATPDLPQDLPEGAERITDLRELLPLLED